MATESRAKVAIVSPLPERTRPTNGASRFTHALAQTLSRHADVEVFCQLTATPDPAATYVVRPSWEPGPFSVLKLLPGLLGSRARCISIQHEMFMYGPLRVNAAFLALLLALRVTGRRIVVTMHHAMTAKELALTLASGGYTYPLLCPLFPLGIGFFNGAVALLGDRAIVHSRESLAAFPPAVRGRVSVIPLMSEDPPSAAPEPSSQSSGDLPPRYILSFGFVSQYKGIEHLIGAASLLEKQLPPVVIVAGKNVRLSRDGRYLDYYEQLRAAARKAGAIWLDYVPEDTIETLFARADLLVAPYTRFHAASGPIAIAASYRVPVIASRHLSAGEFQHVAIDPSATEIAAAIDRFYRDARFREDLLAALDAYRVGHSAQRVTVRYLEAIGVRRGAARLGR